MDELTVILPLMSAFTGENAVALSMSKNWYSKVTIRDGQHYDIIMIIIMILNVTIINIKEKF